MFKKGDIVALKETEKAYNAIFKIHSDLKVNEFEVVAFDKLANIVRVRSVERPTAKIYSWYPQRLEYAKKLEWE